MPIANSIRSKFLVAGIIVCIAAIAVLGLYIYDEWRIGDEVEGEYASLRTAVRSEEKPQPPTETQTNIPVQQEELPQEIEIENIPEAEVPAGGDMVGWIISEGTVIDYPVMQGKDNEYYLNHLYNGKYSKVGSIFMDYRNDPGLTDRNTVLYGHHMRSGKMFAELEKYKKQAYFEAHPVIYYYTGDETYRIEVFAAVVVSGLDGMPVGFADGAEYEEYLAGLREQSAIQSGVEVNENDRIMTLCACTYDFNNARITVIGKLVKV